MVLLLLLPALSESIDSDAFTVAIPGFPLSLGAVLFILAGLSGFTNGYKFVLNTPIFVGLFLVYIGFLGGAFFSGNTMENLSRSTATLFILISACGLANMWSKRPARWLLDAFFLAMFLYWVWYVLDNTLLRGTFVSYSTLDLLGKVHNHHIPGLHLSIAAIYVALRFFYSEGKLRLQGYYIVGIAILCSLLIESRSNFVFTILTFSIIILKERKKILRFLIIVLPLLWGFYFAIDYFTSHYSFLHQRFSLQDTAYQQRTNLSRITQLLNAPKLFLEYPWGRGIRNIYFDTGFGHKLLMHNQYLTYILAGGLISLIGVIIWLKGLVAIVKRALSTKNPTFQHSFLFASSMTLFIFQITLTTIENGGLFFFFLTSLGIFASKTISLENRFPQNLQYKML